MEELIYLGIVGAGILLMFVISYLLRRSHRKKPPPEMPDSFNRLTASQAAYLLGKDCRTILTIFLFEAVSAGRAKINSIEPPSIEFMLGTGEWRSLLSTQGFDFEVTARLLNTVDAVCREAELIVEGINDKDVRRWIANKIEQKWKKLLGIDEPEKRAEFFLESFDWLMITGEHKTPELTQAKMALPDDFWLCRIVPQVKESAARFALNLRKAIGIIKSAIVSDEALKSYRKERKESRLAKAPLQPLSVYGEFLSPSVAREIKGWNEDFKKGRLDWVKVIARETMKNLGWALDDQNANP